MNALKPGECLSIEKGNGITVVYGNNGSGKSGYARILKSACRTRMKGQQVIHQTLSPEAAKRLQDFETFVKAGARKAEEDAQHQYQRASAAIKQHSMSMTGLTEMFPFVKDEIGNDNPAKRLRRFVPIMPWRLPLALLSVSLPEAQIQATSQSLIERTTALANKKTQENARNWRKNMLNCRTGAGLPW